MDMDLTVIERTGYTVLNILSDVGGLQGILISGISLLLSVLNHNYLDNYLVTKLFKYGSAVCFTALPMTRRIKEFRVARLLPNKLDCCNRVRNQIVMERARASLEREADILRLFQT